MVETCPAGRSTFKVAKNTPCPAFEYNVESMTATCTIAKDVFIGIGAGCCMAARCYKDGVEYDFASLRPDTKKQVVSNIYGGKSCRIQ